VLKALGASTWELVGMLAVQVALVFVLGSAVAGLCACAALAALKRTTISVVISPNLILGALGSMLLCSALGALFSIRKLSATEPGEAFRI
jgi:ABC-type antimicrobial peptide transport system permease subunit